MNKILIVARREFLTRVQNKTFLLVTIFLPLLIFGLYAAIVYFSIKGNDTLRIAVTDKANLFNNNLPGKDDIHFNFLPDETQESLEQKVKTKAYDGYIYIPANMQLTDNLQIVTGSKTGIITREALNGIINNRLEEQRLLSLHVSKEDLQNAKKNISIQYIISGKGENVSGVQSGVAYGVGFGSGFLIYMVLLIYGMAVMRGVMEEKVSRIAEVIISSVKPFQLMMGKILGIGAVGLLQFLIWIVLVVLLRIILLPVLFPGIGEQMHQMTGAANANIAQANEVLQSLKSINFPLIISCFIFYFLGGYFVYAAMFAAVGSAVNENPQDAQSLTLPITLPIIFGIVIMTRAVNAPSSGLAVFGSLFPLTSPMVMMARIAQGVPETVPYWQLLLSMVLLVAMFIFNTWLAGKIYRTGILMYGKKPTWKELIKWAFVKNR
jgi:ABC-2 type transport system permease protein